MKVKLLDFRSSSAWGDIPSELIGKTLEVEKYSIGSFQYRYVGRWYFKEEWVEVVDTEEWVEVVDTKEENNMELKVGNVIQLNDKRVGVVSTVFDNAVDVRIGLDLERVNKSSVEKILADRLPEIMNDVEGKLASSKVCGLMYDELVDLLYEYEYNYEPNAIDTIVDGWNSSKSVLRGILSHHPKWRDDLQMIVLDKATFKNTIDWKTVSKFVKFWEKMSDYYAENHAMKVGPWTISELKMMINRLANAKYAMEKCDERGVFTRYNGMDKEEVSAELNRYETLLRESEYFTYLDDNTIYHYISEEDKNKLDVFNLCKTFLSIIANEKGGEFIDEDARFTKEGVAAWNDFAHNHGFNNEEIPCSYIPQYTQAVSKWVGKCFHNLGLDRYVEMGVKKWTTDDGVYHERPVDNGWNGQRAALGNALKTETYTEDVYISINLIDYMTAAFLYNATSCHSIDKEDRRECHNGDYQGCYSSGTISYGIDDVSLVMYTIKRDGDKVNRIGKEADPNGPIYRATKHRRMMAYVGEDKLICSRVYPDGRDGGDETIADQWRNLLQKVIADCLNSENMWTLKRGSSAASRIADKGCDATCYPDWEHYDDVSTSYLRTIDGVINYKGITIGREPVCVVCGCRHSREDKIICEYCDGSSDYVSCECCGDRFDPEEYGVRTVDGTYFCCEGCAESEGYVYVEGWGWYSVEEAHQDAYTDEWFPPRACGFEVEDLWFENIDHAIDFECVHDDYDDEWYVPDTDYLYDDLDELCFVIEAHDDYVRTEDGRTYVSEDNARQAGYVQDEWGNWAKEESEVA